MKKFRSQILADFDIRHFEQYSGHWAMYEPSCTALVERVNRLDLSAHLNEQFRACGDDEEAAPLKERKLASIDDQGIATVEIRGELTKYGSSLSSAPAMLMLRRTIDTLAQDASARGLLLILHSPGGTVSGTFDLADSIAEFATKKPVVTFGEDLVASAAYAIASQSTKLFASPAALIGSIGTYMVLVDSSKAAADWGYKYEVVKAGEMKGAGVPGTPITDAQRTEAQRTVNDLNSMFLRTVERGRRMSADRVAAVADGRVHLASDALKLGLIDQVGTLAAAYAALQSMSTHQPSGRLVVAPSMEKAAMSDTETKPATLKELKAALPESTAEFREKCLEGSMTVAQATAAWAAHLSEELKATKTQLAEMKAKQAAEGDEPPLKKPGVKALQQASKKTSDEDEGEASGDPIAEWKKRHAAKVSAGKSREQATAELRQEDPELHRSYVQEFNARHRARIAAAAARASAGR